MGCSGEIDRAWGLATAIVAGLADRAEGVSLLLLDEDSRVVRAWLPETRSQDRNPPPLGQSLDDLFRRRGGDSPSGLGTGGTSLQGCLKTRMGMWESAILTVVPLDPSETSHGYRLAMVSRAKKEESPARQAMESGAPALRLEDLEAPCVLVQSTTRTILGLNPEAERLLGWKSAELQKQKTLVIHENEVSYSGFGKALAMADDRAPGLSKGLWRFRKKDGSLFSCHIVPIHPGRPGRRGGDRLYMLLECDACIGDRNYLASLSAEGRRLLEKLEALAHGPPAQKPERVSLSQLTRRQEEIIALLSRGLSSKEIGSQLGLSVSTVNNHIHALYRKYHVSSRIGLAATLGRLGYVGANQSNLSSLSNN